MALVFLCSNDIKIIIQDRVTKMFKKSGLALLLMVFFSIAPSGFNSACAITLDEALKEVVTTHPRILEKIKEFNASTYDIDRFKAGKKPTIDLDAEAGYEDVSNSSTRFTGKDSGIYGGAVTLRQVIYDGKRIENDIKSRNAISKSSFYGYYDAANQIVYETIEKYLDVLKFKSLLDLANENVLVHKKLLSAIKERVDAGTAGKSELERVQGRLASAQAVFIARGNDYKREIYNFHKYMGRFEEGDKMSLPKFNNTILPATLQEALKKQTENHPVLLAAATNIDEKFFEYDRERSEYKPTLYFESSRDFRKNYSGVTGDANSVRALVKMRWNIYDGGARDASTDKMSSLVNREKQIFDRVRRSLLNDLQLTWTGYKLLDSQIGALKKSLMFTRKSLKSYKEEFMLGQRLLINILDAENEYQTMRSQLASIEFELLATKYRLLYSMGNISEDLGLEIPLAKEYKALNKMKPAFKDVLPPDNDLDKDGVKDNMDLSVNSRASSEVDVMGELAGMTKKYAQEPLNNAVVEDSSVIKNKQELQANKLKLDVATRLDLVSFIKGSIELTDSSKKIMREMIEQVRRMANEGIIKVTVDTAEAGKADENYKLAIQRAHNIKKIFAFHNIEPEAIQIFGSASEKGTTENTVILKIETHPEAMKENYETVSLDEIRFENKKEDFKSGVKEALGVLASQIKQKGNPPVEVIVYSNDFDDESENEVISKKRAEKICAELVASGANSGRVVPVGWGNYDASLDLFQGTGEAAINNKTDFIIRSVR